MGLGTPGCRNLEVDRLAAIVKLAASENVEEADVDFKHQQIDRQKLPDTGLSGGETEGPDLESQELSPARCEKEEVFATRPERATVDVQKHQMDTSDVFPQVFNLFSIIVMIANFIVMCLTVWTLRVNVVSLRECPTKCSQIVPKNLRGNISWMSFLFQNEPPRQSLETFVAPPVSGAEPASRGTTWETYLPEEPEVLSMTIQHISSEDRPRSFVMYADYPERIGRELISQGWVCLGFGGRCGDYTGEEASDNALRLASYDLEELALCVAPDLLILYWLDDSNLSQFVGYVRPGMHSKILIVCY